MRFRARLDLIPTQRGGRETPAASAAWRPAFRTRQGEDGTSCFLTADVDFLAPGETYEVRAELLAPDIFAGQLLPGLNFALYEGLRRVADGVILEVTEQDSL